jgi:hypothetical protein
MVTQFQISWIVVAGDSLDRDFSDKIESTWHNQGMFTFTNPHDPYK